MSNNCNRTLAFFAYAARDCAWIGIVTMHARAPAHVRIYTRRADRVSAIIPKARNDNDIARARERRRVAFQAAHSRNAITGVLSRFCAACLRTTICRGVLRGPGATATKACARRRNRSREAERGCDARRAIIRSIRNREFMIISGAAPSACFPLGRTLRRSRYR